MNQRITVRHRLWKNAVSKANGFQVLPDFETKDIHTESVNF